MNYKLIVCRSYLGLICNLKVLLMTYDWQGKPKCDTKNASPEISICIRYNNQINSLFFKPGCGDASTTFHWIKGIWRQPLHTIQRFILFLLYHKILRIKWFTMEKLHEYSMRLRSDRYSFPRNDTMNHGRIIFWMRKMVITSGLQNRKIFKWDKMKREYPSLGTDTENRIWVRDTNDKLRIIWSKVITEFEMTSKRKANGIECKPVR